MATSLTTRITDGSGVESVKETPLTSIEVDNNFITLAENKLERENNLSDLTDTVAGRVNLNVPSREGAGAFGTWSVSITGNSGTATKFQNARKINGIAFDGTSDVEIEAAAPNSLIFGTGLTSSGNYDGSTERIVSIDTNDVVVTTNSQTIAGTKTFSSAVILGTQATAVDQAVRADRLINSGNGLIGGSNLTGDLTLEVDDNIVVVTSGNQTIAGTKTFSNAVVLSTPGTLTTQAVRADRSIAGGDGIDGGGDLTSDVTLDVDSTVIRTTSNQTLGGTKTFSNPPVLSTPSTSVNEAVRSDRNISGGDGLIGGGNLTSDITLDVDNTVVRTNGNQTLGGSKTFSSAVVLEVQGTSLDEAIRGSRNLTAGDGIDGGGDLTADRTFSVDNTVVRSNRIVSAGDGISGGGDLTTDLTFDVDNTVVRTSGNQIIGGQKEFSSNIIIGAQGSTPNEALAAGRSVFAGSGLTGGGDLTTDRTLSVDNTVVRSDRIISAGDGIDGGGDLTADRTFSVDNTVVRSNRIVSAGDGIDGGGDLTVDRSISVDSSVVRTSLQIIPGDGLNGGGALNSDIILNIDNNISNEAVNTDLSKIVTLVVGDVLTSDAESDSDIDSADDSDVTDSDLILDSDYTGLSIGEIVVGLDSGARGIIVEITDDSDSASIDVRIISGTFSGVGEVIEGETSGALIEIESASVTQTFEAQDIRSSGEIIDFIPSSSENIQNVLDIPNALDKVLAIGGKTFDWTDDHLNNKGGTNNYHITQSDFGVVAEDVQSVFPQGVREKENGELVVDYRKLFALAFAAIKELNDKIV